MKPGKPLARHTPLRTLRGLKPSDLPPGLRLKPDAFKPAKPIKRSRPKTTPARKAAEGKPCLVRLPGVCNGDPATTVLAHYRLAGTCGTGMKPIDALGAWACSDCHAEADRRTRKLEADFVRLCFAEGVMRTIVEREKGA